MLFIPAKGHGFANTLIHLCDFFSEHPNGLVHETIKDFELGRWLKFNFPTTDLVVLPIYKPKIFINQYTVQHVHPLIRKLISPSDELQKVIDDHLHLVKDVKAGLHIRRGASAPDSRLIVERDEDLFASDNTVSNFRMISDVFTPYFLASDSPETKKLFPSARTLDTSISVVHDQCPEASTNDRRNIFLDFFLLSMCPVVFCTGGSNTPNSPGVSTFGYMAAIYGGREFKFVS
jgi:hypothetical protein